MCTPSEPPGEAQFCGGFAGIECPGAGACIDDPSDDCDPERGGADCGGLCDCSGALVLCIAGTVFDESPDVCACVPEEPEADPCATVRCAAGTHCEVVGDGAICAPDENPCNLTDCPPGTVCEVQGSEAVCTPAQSEAPFCGGIAAFPCPGAGSCVDDPSDDCDPERGGADCGGVCDCGRVLLLCIAGTVFDDSPDVCACVPGEPEADPCAAVRCAAGTHCEVVDDGAICAPDENPCNLADCQPNTVCEVQDGEAVCVPSEPNPCALVLCAPGKHCEADGSEARCVREHAGPCRPRR